MKKIISILLMSIIMFTAGLSLAQTGTSDQQPSNNGGSDSTASPQPVGDDAPKPSDDKPDPAAVSNIPT